MARIVKGMVVTKYYFVYKKGDTALKTPLLFYAERDNLES
jgi:hypothetical protein